MIRWRFDEVTFTLLMGLDFAQGQADKANLEEVAFRVAEDSMFVDPESPHADIWRRQCGNDVHRLLGQLHPLGAITLNDEQAGLTPLGTGLVAGHCAAKASPRRRGRTCSTRPPK